MLRFNIVNPDREDFVARAVSAKDEDENATPRSDEERASLAASLRKYITDYGVVHDRPIATKTHTVEELEEMGFVAVTLYDYPEHRPQQ